MDAPRRRDPGKVKFPFGKYKGRTIDQVASSNRGLRYLDYLRGNSRIYGEFKAALDTYMEQDEIERELVAALEEGRHGQE